MAKTYTVHYSAKYAAAGSSASATALYGQANPEGIYPAGIYQNKTRAVVCLFSGLSGITASRVTGITLHLQRLAGGSNITYSVNLTHSVLSEPLGISGPPSRCGAASPSLRTTTSSGSGSGTIRMWAENTRRSPSPRACSRS